MEPGLTCAIHLSIIRRIVGLSPMRIANRSNKFVISLFVFAFTVVTLCPFAVEASVPSASATELTSADDTGAMQCHVSWCQANQTSAARQDSFQTTHDVLAHTLVAATFGSGALPYPRQIRTGFVRDDSPPTSAQHVPLYLLHVSLIR